jgi:hypothetical protein
MNNPVLLSVYYNDVILFNDLNVKYVSLVRVGVGWVWDWGGGKRFYLSSGGTYAFI